MGVEDVVLWLNFVILVSIRRYWAVEFMQLQLEIVMIKIKYLIKSWFTSYQQSKLPCARSSQAQVINLCFSFLFGVQFYSVKLWTLSLVRGCEYQLCVKNLKVDNFSLCNLLVLKVIVSFFHYVHIIFFLSLVPFLYSSTSLPFFLPYPFLSRPIPLKSSLTTWVPQELM